jgi:hypothetical protein
MITLIAIHELQLYAVDCAGIKQSIDTTYKFIEILVHKIYILLHHTHFINMI